MIRFKKITFKLFLDPVFGLILVISGCEQIVKSVFRTTSDIYRTFEPADLGMISIRSRFDFDAGFSRTEDQIKIRRSKWKN